MNDPKKLSRDELALLPKVEVFFQHIVQKGTIRIIPSIKLDARLRIDFKELGPVDVATLLLEHNLDTFDKRGMRERKPVLLYKGTVKASRVKKRIGTPWYSVNVIIAPGIVIKHFLNDKEMNYVRHERNKQLEARFIDQDSEDPSAK